MLETAIQLDPQYARAMDLLQSVYQRFWVHVRPDPGQYGMTEAELIRFLERRPEVELAHQALTLCPLLASSYATVETSIPAPQTFADFVEIIDEALKREPGNLELRSRLLGVLLGMGHLTRAGEVADEMYLRDPLDPRNSHIRAWVARLTGRPERAFELEQQALHIGYVERNARAMMACDQLLLGNASGVSETLGPEWQPDNLLVIDPRRIQAARNEQAIREQLREELESKVVDSDARQLGRLIGETCSLLFEFGDDELSRRAMQRYAEVGSPGRLPWILWHHDYRRLFVDDLLGYAIWIDEYRDFWNRVGPPDGCSWSANQLDCEWDADP